MTSNPTPLTAEELKTSAGLIAYHFTRSGDPDDMAELQAAIQAYAAQQNAELVAKNEHLNRLLSRMSWYANIPAASGIDEVDDRREKEWSEFQNALDKLKKGSLLFELEAENERLKQQLTAIQSARYDSAKYDI